MYMLVGVHCCRLCSELGSGGRDGWVWVGGVLQLCLRQFNQHIC